MDQTQEWFPLSSGDDKIGFLVVWIFQNVHFFFFTQENFNETYYKYNLMGAKYILSSHTLDDFPKSLLAQFC